MTVAVEDSRPKWLSVSCYGCRASADPDSGGDLQAGLDGRGEATADRSHVP